MANRERLTQLLTPHRTRILGVLGLEVVQQLAWIAEPFVFGRAIDAVIAHRQRDQLEQLVLHLTVWIGVFTVSSVAGVIQRVASERVLTSLYRDVCTELVRLGAERSAPASQTASRAELYRELVTFLDERAPEIVAGIVNVAGSAVSLALYDPRIVLACALVTLPAVFSQWIVRSRVAPLQREEHDLRERNVDLFASGDPAVVADHFARIGRARVHAARWGAASHALLRVVMLGIFIAVLFISIDVDQLSTGTIYAIVAYLWTFVTYAEDIPVLLESRASLRDLARRLEEQSLDPSDAGGEQVAPSA